MVERCRGVGFDPGYGEGRAVCLADLIVNEGFRQGFEEARLTGSACGDSELDWWFDVFACTVVYFCRLNLAGALSG